MVVVVRKYCSSVIIDENQLSSAHNILSTTKLKTKITITIPHNNRAKRLLLKASSYLSIGQYCLIFQPSIFLNTNFVFKILPEAAILVALYELFVDF